MDQKIMELTIYLRKKYNQLNELLDITKQMADTLQRNDMVSFAFLLNIRTDVILDTEDMTNQMETLFETYEPTFAEKIRLLLSKQELSLENFSTEEKKVRDIVLASARLTQRLIAQDKIINQKISGTDSYYPKK